MVYVNLGQSVLNESWYNLYVLQVLYVTKEDLIYV